jgi:hypothetical protein
MLIRALIVLLLVLNLGVAAWWLARPGTAQTTPDLQPANVPRLQLLAEATTAPAPAVSAENVVAARTDLASPPQAGDAATTEAPAIAAIAAPAAPIPATECFSLGPFESEAGTRAAQSTLGLQAAQAGSRQQPGRSASAYNVYLPAAGGRAAAQALAARIGAAGFDDYLIVNSGELANAIALGRYGSRQGAERRVAALSTAGFPAEIQPVGDEGTAQWWLDVRAPGGLSRQQAQSRSLAPQSRALDCATLR